MSVKLNRFAFDHAVALIEQGDVVRDDRDDWSEHAPSIADENTFVETNGYTEYAEWNLAIDSSEAEDSKERYSFPVGDFAKVHRCAVIALESRAAQHGHNRIARAAKELLAHIDQA